MSKDTVDTLGNQKKTNYALQQDKTKEEFIEELLEGILPPPQYFSKNAMLNKQGYETFDEVLEKGNVPLDPSAFEHLANQTAAVVLDVRSPEEYLKQHVPNSIFIGLNGSFAPWVGALITDLKQPLLLVVPEGKAEEAVTRLSRVGYDNTLGYLEGGLESWIKAGKETQTIDSVDAATFNANYQTQGKNMNILDVRKPGEFDTQHLLAANSFPLDFINENMGELDKEKPYYIHCAGGYRSAIAASILSARGFTKLTDIKGGFGTLKQTDMPISEERSATD